MNRRAKIISLVFIFIGLLTSTLLYGFLFRPWNFIGALDSLFFKNLLRILSYITIIFLLVAFFLVLFQRASDYAIIEEGEEGSLELDKDFLTKYIDMSIEGIEGLDHSSSKVFIDRKNPGSLKVTLTAFIIKDEDLKDMSQIIKDKIRSSLTNLYPFGKIEIDVKYRLFERKEEPKKRVI